MALVRSLEKDPRREDADAIRQQLRDWALGVPDIKFTVCPGLLVDAVGNYRHSREITLQVMLSGAVLRIEDPGQARDDARVYWAGVVGALRAYDVLAASMSDARSAGLDELVEKRDRGELFDHIARLAGEKCPKSNAMLIAAPTGAAAGLLLAVLVTYGFGRRRASRQAELTRASTSSAGTAGAVRSVTLICAAYYIAAGIALHILEPEYDPRFQFMSDYAWGSYGWLMTTTFFVLGLAILTVALGLRGAHESRSARLGFGLLVVGAAFVCLAGVFRGFPLHDIASAVAIPSLVLAAVLLSWSFRTATGWQTIHAVTLSISLGMLIAFVSMVVDIGMPGLQQRTLLFLLLAWLSIVADRHARVTARLVQPRHRST